MPRVRQIVFAAVCVVAAALTSALIPLSAAQAAAPPWLYILTGGTDTMTGTTRPSGLVVVNPSTQHVVRPIAIAGLAYEHEISQDAARAYVATSNGVVVVNLVTHTVTGTIDLGTAAYRVELSTDGGRLYAARVGGVAIIDTASFTVTASIEFPNIQDMALSPDGARLFLLTADRVAEFSTTSRTLSGEFTVAAGGVQVLVHPATDRLYVLLDPAPEGSFLNPVSVDTVAAYDLTTRQIVQTLDLPNYNVQIFLPYHSRLGPAVLTHDGSRLLVAQITEGWRTSPTRFLHNEIVRIVDTGSLMVTSSVETPALPNTSGVGSVAMSMWREGATAFGAGGESAFSLDVTTQAAALAGPGLSSVLSVRAVSPHACAFEIWRQQLYVREAGGSTTIDVPAPTGCAWSATSSDSWLSMSSGASGSGAGTITLSAQPTDTPRSATVTVGGQQVTVTQLVSHLEIETPAGGALTQPITVTGWAIDRPSTDRVSPTNSFTTQSGIDAVFVYATPAAGGTPVLLNQGTTNVYHQAVEATYGALYRNAGFSIPVSRMAPGDYTLTVQARSLWDGSLRSATRTITVVREPRLVVEAPLPNTTISQPYPMRGWAADLTAATGTGVDLVEVTAQRDGGAPVVLPDLVYGLARADVAAQVGVPAASFQPGFEVYLRNLLPGSYTVTTRARSIATGTFDVQESRRVTIGSALPFGFVDTPVEGATNLEGAIAVTGWALDDYRVNRVEIWRACVESVDRTRGICRSVTPADAPDDVFVGYATFLPGARPDVRTIHPNHYNNDRSGWGYLLLTNALPHIPNGTPEGGQGTFTLKAYAVDGEGGYFRLGTRTIGLNNDAATRPFGTIDTPDQGATIPGPAFPFNEPQAYPVFGWAMTQLGKCIDTSSAASYRVYVDGVAQTLTPGVNWFSGMSRADVAAAYPGLCNTNTAVAAYYLDTRPLANGLHTIGWDVTDNNGQTAGIGSRFFSVLNTGGDAGAEAPASTGTDAPRRQMEADASASALVRTTARALRAVVGQADTSVWVRADHDGVYRVQLPQAARLAIDLDGPVERGYERRGADVTSLPAGSTLQADEGRFFWQPPIGFLGTFPLVFVAAGERIELSVTIIDPPPVSDDVAVTITSPRAGANPHPIITVTGSAHDPRAVTGTGIDTVHVWARRLDLEVPKSRSPEVQFLGKAELSGDAYTLTSRPLATGTYQIEVYAWVARLGEWAPAATVIIAVR